MIMDNSKSFAHSGGPNDCRRLAENCDSRGTRPPKARGGARFGHFVHWRLLEPASANVLVTLYEPDGIKVTGRVTASGEGM
jgi:hypothetical protein